MFLIQIAIQTWYGLSTEQREELEQNDFTLGDLMDELWLKLS